MRRQAPTKKLSHATKAATKLVPMVASGKFCVLGEYCGLFEYVGRLFWRLDMRPLIAEPSVPTQAMGQMVGRAQKIAKASIFFQSMVRWTKLCQATKRSRPSCPCLAIYTVVVAPG